MNKKYLISGAFFFLLYLLEISAHQVFRDAGFLVPRLTLLFLTIFALRQSFTQIIWIGFLGGLLMEFFSSYFFGAEIFSYLLSGILVYFFTRYVISQDASLVSSFVLTAIVIILFPFWRFIYQNMFDLLNLIQTAPSWREVVSGRLFGGVILNFLSFRIIKSIYKYLPQ